MAEKKPAIRSTKPAPKRTKAAQPQKARPVASIPAPEPQPEPDNLLADKIATTEVVLHLKPSTPAPEPTASPLAAKIAYLRELVGNEAALHDALQRGTVRVQVPGIKATRRTRRDASERPKTKKNWPKAIVAQVRKLRGQGIAYSKIEAQVDGLVPDKGRTAWTIVNALEGDGY